MSSTTKGLRRVGVTGVAALVAVGGFIGSATIAHADLAANGGSISIADQDTNTDNGTQAAMVQPGVNGQALANVQLQIPNTFKKGDTIELALFDRSATTGPAGSNGQINTDAAHKLSFSIAPKVTTDAATGADATNVAPAFTASLAGSANDIVRLTAGADSAGTATDVWTVTLSGVKADIGSAVSPGELRVVPFAYNKTATGSTMSTLFGNTPDNTATAAFDPTIVTYTVPAYVAPVSFTVGTPNNIVTDGTTQRVGDITIAENNNFSLQGGTYTITVDGATVKNNTTNKVSVTLGNAASGESVDANASVSGNEVSFTLTQADVLAASKGKLTVKLSGLLLQAADKGPITYTLSGGSVSDSTATIATPKSAFLVQAGASDKIGSTRPNGVPADSEFGGTPSQTDIVPLSVEFDSAAVPPASRIGGIDRYATAAALALHSGAGADGSMVLASGQNFPDALSSSFLANRVGGSILLTKQGSLPAVTADVMRELGTRTVFVVGGASAVSDAVVNQLKNTPQYYPGGHQTVGQGKLQVIRLGGSDRYATNKVVNEYGAAVSNNPALLGAPAAQALNRDISGGVGRTHITFGERSKLTALVATGENYADALAAGPATAGDGTGSLPLVLTKGSGLSADAASQITDLGIEQAVIVGGSDVVKPAVEASIKSLNGGISIDRLSGDDRYGTAAAVADFETAGDPTNDANGGLGFDSTTAYLATGEAYADALAGGPVAGGWRSPILLTKSANLSAPTQAWLVAHAGDYDQVTGLGLTSAVSQSTLDAANAAISGK